MKAVDIMTTAVVTIRSNASIIDAVRLMLDQRISGLPVVDENGGLVGIVTEGDLLRRAETGTEKTRPRWLQFFRGPGRQAEDYVLTHGRRVDEVMTRDLVTVSETESLEDIVELMERKRIRRIPVLMDGRLAGVVSRADLLRALVQELTETAPAASSDTDVRQQVVAALSGQPWRGGSHVTAIVTERVVYLEGTITDEREREAIRVAAENIPGVKEVCDHLDYFDPNTGLMYGL